MTDNHIKTIPVPLASAKPSRRRDVQEERPRSSLAFNLIGLMAVGGVYLTTNQIDHELAIDLAIGVAVSWGVLALWKRMRG